MYTFKSNVPLLVSVVVAFVAAFGVIITSGMPYFGFALTWVAVSSVVYWYKPIKTRFTKLSYILSLVLSFCFMWRANPLLTLFNFIGAVGLTTVMAIMYEEETLPGVLRMLFSPLTVFMKTMSTQIQYSAEVRSDAVQKYLKKLKFQESFVSILVTVVSLGIIIPLLASSNPFFKNAFDESIALLNLERLWRLLQGWQFSAWTVAQLAVFGFLLVAVPRLIAYLALQKKRAQQPTTAERSMLLPKLMVAAVLLLFFATQIQLYVASDAQLLAVGSTPSQRTQEVFGQLSVVIGVVLSLLYFFRSYAQRERQLSLILLVESGFLTAIAFSSVYQYALNFGFTFKRLWGIAVVFWLVAVLLMYARAYWQKVANEYVVQQLLLISAVALVLVNVMNFDYLIAHVHRPRTGAGTDYEYVLHNVSSDARAEKLLLAAFAQQEQSDDVSVASIARFNQLVVLGNIERLQQAYDKLDLRTLNLSQLLAYRAVADVRIDELRRQIEQRDMQQIESVGVELGVDPSPWPVTQSQ